MNKLNIKQMVKIALLTAVLCVLGPLSFPLSFSAVPVSLGILGIFLAIVILDSKEAVISVAIYILLGLVGVPVFANFTGGVGKLFGPTGGYIIGYIPLAVIASIFITKSKRNIVMSAVGMVVGTAVCYAFGTAWLAISAGMDFKAALMAGVIPFIPFDAVKLVVSMIIGLPVRRAIMKIS